MHETDRGGPGPDGEGMRCPEGIRHFATRHLDALHDALKLTSGQQSAWKAYRDAELVRFDKKPQGPEEPKELSAPERLEKMIADLGKHQQELNATLAVTKKFYAQLTPEQQKIFDRESAPRHPPRGGEGRKAPPPPQP
ncbi:Spy/CpxP family protein refolding chaperone [Niveibacterium terrae]|uniref:Spy/CpxP family protein refolding chaperone n=1 Tax=Niveibacterium terrae TaxID=3373598 RepID=UPI003A95BB1C